MRTTMLTIFGAALLAATLLQTATATERRHVSRATCVCGPTGQAYRDTNAYDWPARRVAVPDWYRYVEGGVTSAPAGH